MEVPRDIKHLYITWLDEAVQKFQVRQNKTAIIMGKAAKELKDHEGPLRYPEELVKVKGCGNWIVTQMRKRLETYCEEHGWTLPPPPPEKAAKAGKKRQSEGGDDPNKKKRKAASDKPYVPAKRSGGYAILLALLERDEQQNGLSKEAIIASASQHCNSSFTNNPSTAGGSYGFSAWKSIDTLRAKELVVMSTGRPQRYYMTDEGLELAKKIKENDGIAFGGDTSDTRTTPESQGQFEDRVPEVRIPRDRVEESYEGVSYFHWPAGSYDVKFVVDNREMRSAKERDFFGTKLQQMGIDCSKKALTVGDGLWIARHKTTNEEVVLNYILERKRLDDLAQSIQDGRYTEQKSRLKRTGIQNVYYLIEEVTSSDLANMSEAIQTSISLNVTVSDFHVQRTKDADATVHFIAKLTKEITKFYSKKTILVLNPHSLTSQLDYKRTLDMFRDKFTTSKCEVCHQYSTFDSLLSKTAMMTARELFVRMLMTVRGISLEKAIAIQKEFPTPAIMFEEFDANDKDFQSRHGKKITELLGEIFTNY